MVRIELIDGKLKVKGKDVTGLDGFDLTVARRKLVGVGRGSGQLMRGIIPATGTFTEGVNGARPRGRTLRIREKGGWKDEPVNPDEIRHIGQDLL